MAKSSVMDGWKGHRSRRTGNFYKLKVCVCVSIRKLCQKKDRLYLKGTVTGTMVDLMEVTDRDPEPSGTKLISILVRRFRIPQLKFYKTLSHIRRCFIR